MKLQKTRKQFQLLVKCIINFTAVNKSNSELMDFVSGNESKIKREGKEFEDSIIKTLKNKLLIKTSSDTYSTICEKLPCNVGIFKNQLTESF